MHTKDDMIAAAKALAARSGSRPLQYDSFVAETGYTKRRIRKEFCGWPAFCVAAGLACTERNDLRSQPQMPPQCGDPLRFDALLRAPISEAGVILAFGMFAERLGYAVETVKPAFPDCIAKRRVGDGRWESVRIEFEYRSRNFRAHGHDPNGCDLIVCWTHDWPDCPIEVLELRSALATMPAGFGAA
jgi:hypothetical protein